MKFIIGIISFVFFLVLAIPVIAYLALQNIGTEKLKPVLANAAMEKTGRELMVNGDIEAEFSFTPTISVSDITLANPDWVEDGAMVHIDSLHVSLDLQQLLQKRIIIDSIVVNGADVILVKEAQRDSWTFDVMNKKPVSQNDDNDRSMQQMKKSLVNLEIGDITFNNSTVLFVDQKKKFNAAFPVLNATIQPNISLDGTANYQGLSANFEIMPKASSIDSLMDEAVNIVLKAALKDQASFHIKGDVSSLQDTPVFDGKITGNVTSLHHLNTLIPDGSLSATDPITFDINAKASAQKLNTVINSVQYGATTVKGKADILLHKTKPYITANITIPSYIIQTQKSSASNDKTPIQTRNDDASKDVIDLSGLQAFNGSFTVALDNLKKDSDTLATNITAKAVLKDGRMNITDYSANAYGGNARGSAVLNGSSNIPSMSLKSSLTGYTISGLLSQFTDYKNISKGNVNADISVISSGKTSDALLQNIDGDIAYTLGETFISVPETATKLNAFLNILRGKEVTDKNVKITCSIGKLKLNNGVARADTLLLDTPGAVVSAEGTVDIANENIAMTLSPRTKLAGLTDVTIPVKVSGSFSNMRFTPDAKGTLSAISKIGLSLIKDKSGISQLVGTALAENIKTANLPDSCLKTLPQDTGADLTTREGLKKLEDDLKAQGKNIEKNVRAIRDDYKAQGKNIEQNVRAQRDDLKQQGKQVEKEIRNIRDNLKGLKDLF